MLTAQRVCLGWASLAESKETLVSWQGMENTKDGIKFPLAEEERASKDITGMRKGCGVTLHKVTLV